MAISGGDAVLAQQPAEPVGPLDPSQDGEPLQSRIGDRGAEIGTSMWSLVVVMLDELPQYPFQVASPLMSNQSRHTRSSLFARTFRRRRSRGATARVS